MKVKKRVLQFVIGEGKAGLIGFHFFQDGKPKGTGSAYTIQRFADYVIKACRKAHTKEAQIGIVAGTPEPFVVGLRRQLRPLLAVAGGLKVPPIRVR
jgi:hypothetical protein